MKTEAETGIILPRASGSLGPPEVGKSKEASTHRGYRERITLSTPWFQPSGLQNCEGVRFCGFKSHS